MAQVSVSVRATGVGADKVGELTRDLCNTIQDEPDVSATVVESETGGARDALTVGTFVMAFVTSGAAVAMFNAIRAYFDRTRSLELVFKRGDGETLLIRAKNMKGEAFDRLVDEAKAFFGQG